MYLSWPGGTSVNDSINHSTYLSTEFVLKFPVVDDIVNRVILLQDKCLLYKILIIQILYNWYKITNYLV